METDPDSPEFNNKVIAKQAVEISEKEDLIGHLNEAVKGYQQEVNELAKTIEGQNKTISYLSTKLNKLRYGWGARLQIQVDYFRDKIKLWMTMRNL